jgi:O-antigen ligase
VVTLSLWIHRFHERRFPPLTLLAFVLTATALIATFSRGFWIGTIVALFFLFLLLDRSKKILVLAGALGLLITVVGVLWLFAGDLGQAIVSTIGSRFLSSGKALEDVSFANRLVESAAAFDAILKSPILGHGLGSSIHYFSLLNELTVESWYLHNGYLFLLFKVGFFGTLLFLGFYGSVLLRGLKAARATKGNSELSPVLRGTWAALASFVIVTITSNVFIERESLLLISLGSAFLMNMHDEHQGYDARTFT